MVTGNNRSAIYSIQYKSYISGDKLTIEKKNDFLKKSYEKTIALINEHKENVFLYVSWNMICVPIQNHVQLR